MTFLEAMAHEEGFNIHGSRAQRNNNPANIEWGKFAQAHGADSVEVPHGHEAARFAHFPDPITGFGAMKALLQAPHYAGLTVAAAISRWAPSSENDTASYIANVCKWAGCQPTDIIDNLLQIPVYSEAQ